MSPAPAVERRPADTRAGFYRPELDILRFGAFVLVFLNHALPHAAAAYPGAVLLGHALAGLARAGGLGVDLFFALSAYLLTELLLRERRARGTLDIRAFYIRRILRIWPLYYFTLLILTPALSGLPGEPMSRGYFLAFLLLGGNWACAAWGYPQSSFALLWSVSIEEQFYFVWPWLARLGVRRLRLIAFGMCAAASATRVALVLDHVRHPGIWCNTFARLDPIAGGALLACSLNGALPQLSACSRALWISLGAGALLACGALGIQDGWFVLLTCPLTAAASVMVIFGALGARLPRRTYSRAGIYLGKISYGLYVFHDAAIRVTGSPMVALPVTVAMAAVSYRYLEAPFLRLKSRFTHVASRAT